MLEINLLPENLSKARKKKSISSNLNIPLEIIVGLGGGLIAILIFVHLILLVTNIHKLSRHKNFKNQWEDLAPAKNEADTVVNELRQLQAQFKAVDEITRKNQILWSQKLNVISNALPRGVWFKKVIYDGEALFLDGSAISREDDEMINIHNFTANLKKEDAFTKDIADLELSSIQSRKLKNVEIADFLITTEIK